MPKATGTERGQTSMRLYRSTAEELHDWKGFGESYDDVIRRLLDVYDLKRDSETHEEFVQRIEHADGPEGGD